MYTNLCVCMCEGDDDVAFSFLLLVLIRALESPLLVMRKEESQHFYKEIYIFFQGTQHGTKTCRLSNHKTSVTSKSWRCRYP